MRTYFVPLAALAAACAVPAAAQDEDCNTFRSGAEAGVSDDQLDLAICLFGSDSDSERSEGMEWARKAMAAGDVEAGGDWEAEIDRAFARCLFGQVPSAEHEIERRGDIEEDIERGLEPVEASTAC